MSNLYRGPAIDASYQVSVHWSSSFRGEDLKKLANQKQELPMAAMYVLPSFTSFGWGISEEKIKMWKVNGRRTPSDGKSSHCLRQGELKIKRAVQFLFFIFNVKYLGYDLHVSFNYLHLLLNTLAVTFKRPYCTSSIQPILSESIPLCKYFLPLW